MADEPQGLSLEEPELVGPITTPAEPEPEPVPEGTIDGSGGVKFAPLAAVIAERTQRKETAKENAALKEKLTAAEQKAAKFDELSGYVEQARPIIERVRANPALAHPDPPKQEPQKALSDADAIDFAKDLDLYKTDGTPDVDRAQRIAGRNAALAATSAKAAIAPFQAQDAQRGAADMRASMLRFKDANGETVDPVALDEMFKVVPAELSARPEVARVLYLAAKGLQAHVSKAKAPGPGPVVETESVGGGNRGPAELSDVESKFARASGMKTADFKTTSSRFKPGAVNSLE